MCWYLVNIKDIGLKKELSLYTYNNYLMFTITGSGFADLIYLVMQMELIRL